MMEQEKANPLKFSFESAESANIGDYVGEQRRDAPISGLEKRMLRRLLQAIGNPPLRIVLWDGKELLRSAAEPETGLIIHDRSTLRRLLYNPDLNFGDEYRAGRLDVEGGLVRFIETLHRARLQYFDDSQLQWQLLKLWNRPRSNSLAGSRKNIHHHYDLGNDFYRLWLDQEMQYTCAYMPHAEMSLEAAQAAKVDHVCRKLQLQPGEKVIEAGCGWGATALHMARHYGVQVRAFNISQEQLDWARHRARTEGLERQVEFVEDDYRNINGSCDAFVSIGMLEHVGVDNYAELGQVVNRCLAASGRGLIHSIGQNQAQPMNPWIEKHIFPGAYPPTLREMLGVLEPIPFSVLDVENLRLHYAETIEHWLARFEQHAPEVERMFDASFVRAWRLYLASSIASFTAGGLQLFQVLFARPGNNEFQWRSRAHLYSHDKH